MAEGIAGSTPSTAELESGNIDMSFLSKLCEAGHQSVTVTGVYKKNVSLMFPHANSMIRHLEDVVLAGPLCGKEIKWSARFLVDKAAERMPLQPHPEHPTTKRPP